MSQAPFYLSRDSTEVLSILLVAWTLAVVAWGLWCSWPGRGARTAREPHPPPASPMPRARAKQARLTVLRGPDNG